MGVCELRSEWFGSDMIFLTWRIFSQKTIKRADARP